jgi:hypothetical protein
MSSTRATSNQFSWRQFTEREREQREQREKSEMSNGCGRGRLHSSKEPEDYNEVEVKTPRRSTRNSAKNVEFQVDKKTTKNVTITVTKPVEMSNQTIQTKSFENVQPIRTRSQKRLADAADAMVQLQQASIGIPQNQNSREKKERRSNYWVKRDDKRRQSDRILKIQKQCSQ